MEMNVNKTSIDEFYKEMFKGSDKNQQLRSLELAFNALLDNKMAILNKQLTKLGSHNVFNQNGTITMEKIKDGGFVFQINNIKILNKDYKPIYLAGNNILNLMDQLIENVMYLEAFVNIAEKSTKKLKHDEKKKVTDKLLTEAYEEFPNPSVNLQEVEKDTKAEITVKTTLNDIVEKLPPKLKESVSNLKNEEVVNNMLKEVAGNPQMIESIAKEKVSTKVAEVIEQVAPTLIAETSDTKSAKDLAKDLGKAIENTPLAEKVDPEALTKPMSYTQTPEIPVLQTVDQVLNTLETPKQNKEAEKTNDGISERPLNEKEKEQLDKTLGTKENPYPNINLDKIKAPSLERDDLANLSPEEQKKKLEEIQQSQMGPSINK